jgi:hypothetical protein
MRRAPRKDRNHAEVAQYLRAIGWRVFDTAAHGGGLGDLLVSRPGFAAVVEVKDGELPPSHRKLTLAEVKFSQDYAGPYIVALNPTDAEHQLRFIYEDFRKGRIKTCEIS